MYDEIRPILGTAIEIIGRSNRGYREWLDDGLRDLLTGRSLLTDEDFAHEFVVYPDVAVRVTSIRHPMTQEWVPFDPPLTVRLDRLEDEIGLCQRAMQDAWWSDPDRVGTQLEPRRLEYPVVGLPAMLDGGNEP